MEWKPLVTNHGLSTIRGVNQGLVSRFITTAVARSLSITVPNEDPYKNQCQISSEDLILHIPDVFYVIILSIVTLVYLKAVATVQGSGYSF